MADEFTYYVLDDGVGTRVDRFLVDNMEGYTRSSLQRLLDEGNVLVGNSPVAKNYKCKQSKENTISVPDAKPLDLEAQNIP